MQIFVESIPLCINYHNQVQLYIINMIAKYLLILVLLNSASCLSNGELFYLSDTELFQMGINQFRNGINTNQLGRCAISDDPHACSHYAKVCDGNGTCLGLPDLYGSGCLQGCWGPPNTYLNYQNTKLPICTGNVTKNGANMLRIGILKGYCGINNNFSNASSNAPFSNSSGCLTDAQIFFLSDTNLFSLGLYQWYHGLHSNSLENCVISNDPHACSHYAGLCYPTGQCYGLPDRYGSGCLDGCWGPPNTYYNYQNSVTPVCTGNLTIDAANMMRIGIVKGFCRYPNSILSNCSATNSSANNSNSSNANSSHANSSSSTNSTNSSSSNSSSTNSSSNINNTNSSSTNNTSNFNFSSNSSSSTNFSNTSTSNLHIYQNTNLSIELTERSNINVSVNAQVKQNQMIVVWTYWLGWAFAAVLLIITIVLLIVLFKQIKRRNREDIFNQTYVDNKNHIQIGHSKHELAS